MKNGATRDLSNPTRVARRLPAGRLAVGALALAFLTGGAAHAATFGHARLASGAGEPLLILVPVSGLTEADLSALSARPAPAADWAQAGLTPPVPLDSLSVSVGADVRPGGRRVLRIGSGQAFTGNLADLLLDVHTATGEQRYQVSLVSPEPARAAAASAAAQPAKQGASANAVGAAAPHASTRRVPAGAIAVRPGDTMFAIGRRHAVDGVSIYQLMMALQRANPQAFIHDNVNLVRAGASLAVPDINDMLSISDAEARRQFQAQAAAFARMRGRLAGAAAAATDAGQAATGTVSQDDSRANARPAAAAGDHLRLSESGAKGQSADAAADARTARGHALKDAESRVDQLEGNVKNLNQALQSQGEAARSAASQGVEAIGQSIQQIAGAISEASQEAAAQANETAPAGGEPHASGAGTSGAVGANAASSGAAGTGTPGSQAAGGAASGTGSTAAGGASSTASAGSRASSASSAGSPAAAGADSAARVAEQPPSERTQDRVSWLQDHLLGVMTGLLALIVLIIAWLLRRANAARDEADASPRVTESMVRERIQDIDLNLEPGESRPPQQH